MTEFIENVLRDNPKPRKSPRKSCPIKDDEIDEFLWNGNAGDIVTDSFAFTGDVSTELQKMMLVTVGRQGRRRIYALLDLVLPILFHDNKPCNTLLVILLLLLLAVCAQN